MSQWSPAAVIGLVLVTTVCIGVLTIIATAAIRGPGAVTPDTATNTYRLLDMALIGGLGLLGAKFIKDSGEMKS